MVVLLGHLFPWGCCSCVTFIILNKTPFPGNERLQPSFSEWVWYRVMQRQDHNPDHTRLSLELHLISAYNDLLPWKISRREHLCNAMNLKHPVSLLCIVCDLHARFNLLTLAAAGSARSSFELLVSILSWFFSLVMTDPALACKLSWNQVVPPREKWNDDDDIGFYCRGQNLEVFMGWGNDLPGCYEAVFRCLPIS